MGSLVSANMVIEDIEQNAPSTFHTPRFWRWYIDETSTVLAGDLVDCFHSHLNSINNNIQFTVEESDGQLSFLDILLTREEGSSISTSM